MCNATFVDATCVSQWFCYITLICFVYHIRDGESGDDCTRSVSFATGRSFGASFAVKSFLLILTCLRW